MGGDGNFGTGDLGVSAADRNDLGGIGHQLLSMEVDVEVECISKMLLLPYHTQH